MHVQPKSESICKKKFAVQFPKKGKTVPIDGKYSINQVSSPNVVTHLKCSPMLICIHFFLLLSLSYKWTMKNLESAYWLSHAFYSQHGPMRAAIVTKTRAREQSIKRTLQSCPLSDDDENVIYARALLTAMKELNM